MTYTYKTSIALAIVMVGAFIAISAYSASPLRMNGHGVINEFRELNFAAIEHKDGSTKGYVTFPGGLSGPVVELVAPSETYDHWCVGFEERSIANYNVLVYVRDIGDGQTTFDEVAFRDGFGINCVDSPTPAGSFTALDSGDYQSSL